MKVPVQRTFFEQEGDYDHVGRRGGIIDFRIVDSGFMTDSGDHVNTS